MFKIQSLFVKRLMFSAYLSMTLVIGIFVAAIIPVIQPYTNAATTPTTSTTTLTVSTEDLNIPIDLAQTNNTFFEGSANIGVATDNYSGYTLSIRAAADEEDSSKLVNGEYSLESIATARQSASFEENTWGYKPSKYNSASNNNFLPAPSYVGDVIESTSAANTTANSYSITLGTKISKTVHGGNYKNSFVIVAIANPVTYTINYNKNTTADVSNVPETQYGTTSDTELTLSNLEPARAGYDFLGWCDGTISTSNHIDSCSGNTYDPSDTIYLDQTISNEINLKAMWQAHNIAISYSLKNGTAGTNKPVSAYYDTNITISNPTKTVTITGDANGTNATVGSATSKAQTFSGWTSSTLGPNAKTGTSASAINTAWTGTSTKNQYFKNLNESGTVTLDANWTPVEMTLPTLQKAGNTCKWYTDPSGTSGGYDSGAAYTPAANSSANIIMYAQCEPIDYTITLQSSNGVSVLTASGWTNSGAASISKIYHIGDTINLGSITPTYKTGYSGVKYSKASGAGSISSSTFTVGEGNATVNISASSLDTPVCKMQGGTTKVYNRSDTTLTATSNSGSYDADSANITYSFGYASSATADLGNFGTASANNTITIAKNAYRAIRYYGVKVTVTDKNDSTITSNCTSGTGTNTGTNESNRTTMGLVNSRIDFYVGAGTMTGANPGYVPYNSKSFYTGRLNTTAGTFPTVTAPTGYTFEGWYTAETGGTKVVAADGTMQTSVSGWTNASGNWVKTGVNDTANQAANALYAQYSANTYTIAYTMRGGTNASGNPTTGTYDSNVTIANPTKTVTVTGNANGTSATIGSATSAAQTFSGWTSTTMGSNALTGTSASDVSTVWTGTSTKNQYFKNLKESGTVTMVANWTAKKVVLPTLSKEGYSCKWYTDATGGSEMGAGGSEWTPGANSSAAVTAYARCTIEDPATPTITGGNTTVYNYANRNLTCATTTTYATGTNKYYQFGYSDSTTDFDNGVITWIDTPKTSATYSVAKNAFIGARYYTCRVYASDGTQTSSTVAATTTTTKQLVNARVFFNVDDNGGTRSGSARVYVPYGMTNVYNSRTALTAGTIPVATKTGHTFQGWFTAATGGTKVIAADRTVQASVADWTDGSKNWQLTSTANNDTTYILYAQFTVNTYAVTLNSKGGTGGTASVTATYGSAMPSATMPTRTGYTFLGYFDAETGGTKYYNANGTSAKNWDKTSDTTLYAQWQGNTYTATIFYNDNSNAGATSVTSTTASCTVSNTAGNCSPTIPTAVTGSVGTYNNAYVGVASATGTMSSAATITLTGNAKYYAVYRTNVKMYKPSSTSAATTVNLYRNQWFTSDTAMASTVLSNSTTGKTNYTYSEVAGYTLYGFNTETNLASRVSTCGAAGASACSGIPALATSVHTSVYSVERVSVSATFYYNNNTVTDSCTTAAVTSTTGSAYRYLYTTSTSTATVKNNNIAVPNDVKNSKGTCGMAYYNVGTETGSMAEATPKTDTVDAVYYARYGAEITNYYYDTAYTNRKIYRNQRVTGTAASNMSTIVLATARTGLCNYDDPNCNGTYVRPAGPGSSVWTGLNTALSNTTATYNSASAAATANAIYSTLSTIYTFNVTFAKGSNVSSIGATSGSCKVSSTGASAGGTSCNVKSPTISPATGYSANGWSPTKDDPNAGTTAGNNILIDTNAQTYYGNAKINTYKLAVTFAGTGVSSVKVCKTSGNCSGNNLMGTISTSGGEVSSLVYNTAYYLYPTYTTGYTLDNWAQTSTAGTLSSTSAANPTFTMGAGDGAVTITGKISSYTITVKAGNGISTLALSGWTNTGTATLTRTLQYGSTVNLASFTPTYKTGYSGKKYAKTSGEGSISSSTFTVGAGAATITINANALATPVCTMQGGTGKVYNRSATTLTATDNSSSYDTSSVNITYSFGYASSDTGTLGNFGTAGTSNTLSVAKNSHYGWRYYGVKVVVTDKSDSSITANCTSGTGSNTGTNVANRTTLALVNARVSFDANGGSISAGNNPAYVAYGGTAYYTGRTNTTAATFPTATRTGYTNDGWYTAASGGSKVANTDGTLTGTAVSNWSNASKQWVLTGTGDTATTNVLYAHWTANTYTVTLDRNGGSGGTGSVTATYASAMPGITVPSRTGWVFDGYYDAASGGTKYYNANGSSARTWNKTSNTKLYAHWYDNTTPTITVKSGHYDFADTSNVYTVTFGGSGGSVSCVNTSNSNAGVTTIRSIDAIGRNTIKCTATGNNTGSTQKTASDQQTILVDYTVQGGSMRYTTDCGTYVNSSNNGLYLQPRCTGYYDWQFGPYVNARAGNYKVTYSVVNRNSGSEENNNLVVRPTYNAGQNILPANNLMRGIATISYDTTVPSGGVSKFEVTIGNAAAQEVAIYHYTIEAQ